MSIVKHENEWKYADSAHLTLQKVLHLINPSPSPFDKDHRGNISGRSPFKLCGSFKHIQSDAWGTPANIIKLVKDVLRYIELDPASSDIDQKIVGPKRYFTTKNDGLGQDWCAETLFMNCPYSNPLPWITKAIHEHSSGHVKQMISRHCCDHNRVRVSPRGLLSVAFV
jgi:hypothetical protein